MGASVLHLACQERTLARHVLVGLYNRLCLHREKNGRCVTVPSCETCHSHPMCAALAHLPRFGNYRGSCLQLKAAEYFGQDDSVLIYVDTSFFFLVKGFSIHLHT